jgi:hypothetical protein
MQIGVDIISQRYKAEKPAHNRSLNAPGFRSPRSFRYAPFPRLTTPTFCQPWSLLRKALIRSGKTSHTAETLCAIGFEICWEYSKTIVC